MRCLGTRLYRLTDETTAPFYNTKFTFASFFLTRPRRPSTFCADSTMLASHFVGVRRCDRGARHAFRGVLQRLYPHHAAPARQPHPLDIGPGRGRRGTGERRRHRCGGPLKTSFCAIYVSHAFYIRFFSFVDFAFPCPLLI